MPFYDYVCDDCGPFTRLRPMAQSADPHDCPDCSGSSRRALLSAPNLAIMDNGRRSAFATNERAAAAPKLASSIHGSGCGCCGPKAKSAGSTAAKTFPDKRPWMISH